MIIPWEIINNFCEEYVNSSIDLSNELKIFLDILNILD